MAGRLRAEATRYAALMDVMCEDILAPARHVAALGEALAAHYTDPAFTRVLTMGDLVARSLERLLERAEPASLRLFAGV